MPVDPEALAARGARHLRVHFSDLHGVARGKDIPLDEVANVLEAGIACTEAILTTNLRHAPTAGSEHGFRDLAIVPDADTFGMVAWDPETAWCIADLVDPATGQAFPACPRGALRRAIERCRAAGIEPVTAPELEFYIVEAATREPYATRDSAVYTVGEAADPRRILRTLTDAAAAAGLEPIAATQEFGRGQYEINLRHGPALAAADRAFRLKALVKDVAAMRGLHATFMAKPRSDDDTSGFHLHLSGLDPDGRNAFDDAAAPHGLSAAARSFLAGILEHAPGLTAVLAPTINSYRRLVPGGLAPTTASWGLDNRLAMIRVPPERGAATRCEVRLADASANPYLATAALLVAGCDGLERALELPPASVGAAVTGPALPRSLEVALDALLADEALVAGLGAELVAAVAINKRDELARFAPHVTQWERDEYMELL